MKNSNYINVAKPDLEKINEAEYPTTMTITEFRKRLREDKFDMDWDNTHSKSTAWFIRFTGRFTGVANTYAIGRIFVIEYSEKYSYVRNNQLSLKATPVKIKISYRANNKDVTVTDDTGKKLSVEALVEILPNKITDFDGYESIIDHPDRPS